MQKRDEPAPIVERTTYATCPINGTSRVGRFIIKIYYLCLKFAVHLLKAATQEAPLPPSASKDFTINMDSLIVVLNKNVLQKIRLQKVTSRQLPRNFKIKMRIFIITLFLLSVVYARNIYGLYVDGNKIKNGDDTVVRWRVRCISVGNSKQNRELIVLAQSTCAYR